MKKNLLLCFIICCLCAAYFFYKTTTVDSTKKKFTIVATTSLIADAVKNIVGESSVVQLYELMGPGVDPHVYRARESDVHKLADADVIFYNGLHLEGKMGQILEGMHRFTKTVAVTDAIDKALLRAVDFDDMYDPHVWFDVSLWIIVVEYIQQQVMLCDPDRADVYKINGDDYIKKLEALQKYIHSKIEFLSEHGKILITAHDAFGYFGRAYGFEVVGLQGLSTDSDISTKDIQQLADYIVNKKVRAIFVESSIPQRAIIAVQNAVFARGWNVIVGDELYSDALGNESSEAGSYCGMITHNINTIINSLGE